MKYIIGRNETNGQLRIICGQNQKSVGVQGSVPATVSRQHMELDQIEGTTDFNLRNLKATNETFVNGLSVISKRVTPRDTIEMGADRYRFDWNLIDIPVIVDVSHLKKVWDDYKKKRKELQVKRERFGAIRGVAGAFSMIGIMVTIVFAQSSDSKGIDLRLVFIGIGLLFILATTAIAWLKASTNADEQDRIDEEFRHRYVCPSPECHHFLGNQPFDVLIQNSRCPYCKAQFARKTKR